MKKFPKNCPICKDSLVRYEPREEESHDYNITYCDNCRLPTKDTSTRRNTAFEVRIGKHTERYLTRIFLLYEDWEIVYYPISDEKSPPELQISKCNKNVICDTFGEEGLFTAEDWEDWSDLEVIINKIKTILAFA